jgi:Zn-dependent protease with chaperone function
MLRHILRRPVLSLAPMALISGLSFATGDLQAGQGATQLTARAPGEVALALAAIGAGSAAEIKGRLFTNRITVFTAEFRTQAVAALPPLIRDHRITQGKLLRRVEVIFSQVLQLHARSDKVELFLFQDDVPTAMLWRGCVLALSDGIADPLHDGELAGIVAHELGHSYFEDEMAAAWKTRDTRAMKVIELKCDAVAILSLKLLDRDPSLYLRGLQRIREIMRRKSVSSGIFQSHPELVERAQFSQHFIRTLRSGEVGLFNNRVSSDSFHQLDFFQQVSVLLDQREQQPTKEKS